MNQLKECKLKRECRHCGHDKGFIVKSNNMHPARVNCAKCGHFHKWLNREQVALAKQMGLFADE